MGQSQFMPSSFLAYAVDYNKDNKIDLWNSYEDIFASIANYLYKHGWNKNKNWSVEYIPKDEYLNKLTENKIYLNNDLIRYSNKKNINKYLSYATSAKVKIIKKNPNKRFFLEFSNFKVVKKYNNSDFYALVVGDLANRITE
jgi:membrane-bound lytic murein transglycosylase B